MLADLVLPGDLRPRHLFGAHLEDRSAPDHSTLSRRIDADRLPPHQARVGEPLS